MKKEAAVRFFYLLFCTVALLIFSSCSKEPRNRFQGYIEGEFVYVASPLAGALESLNVQRGAQVNAGDLLFNLENASEKDALNEARQRLAQAQANLADIKKGKRPSEIESLEAQLQQAKAALEFSESEWARQEKLSQIPGASAKQELDRARSARDQDLQRIAQIEAELKTARLGSRADQIAASEANICALEAAQAKAEWNFSQKSQSAPQASLVFDTLFREGEWVPAGRPVVVLLPPQNIKMRTFVPETVISFIHYGDFVRVTADGMDGTITGRVSFISPQAEYTPPVIFSRENRRKLVFMIEAVFDPQMAVMLHPGQPVDVEFGF